MSYDQFVGPMQKHDGPLMQMCITAGMNTADQAHIRPEYKDSFDPLDAPSCFPVGGLHSFTYGAYSMACGNSRARDYF